MTKITPSLVVVVQLLVVLAPGRTKVISKMYNNNDPLQPSPTYYHGQPEKVKDEMRVCVCPGEKSQQEVSFKEPHKDVIYEDMQSALEDIIKQIPFSKNLKYEISYNEYSDGDEDRHSSEMHSSFGDSQVDSSSNTKSGELNLPKESESNSSPTPKEIEKVSSSSEDNPKVIKQVIFIEPPEYVYKHEFNIQRAPATPRTVIYVFPPQVKHEYNISKDPSDSLKMIKTEEPIVYYLKMNDHLTEMYMSTESHQNAESDKSLINHQTSFKLLDSETKNYFNLKHPTLSEIDSQASQISDRTVDSEEYMTRKIKPVEEIAEQPILPESMVTKYNVQSPSQSEISHVPNTILSTIPTLTVQRESLTRSVHMKSTSFQDTKKPTYKSVSSNPILHTNWQIPETQSSETVEVKHSDNSKSDFEIIPAILQNYFYISPEETYPL